MSHVIKIVVIKSHHLKEVKSWNVSTLEKGVGGIFQQSLEISNMTDHTAWKKKMQSFQILPCVQVGNLFIIPPYETTATQLRYLEYICKI